MPEEVEPPRIEYMWTRPERAEEATGIIKNLAVTLQDHPQETLNVLTGLKSPTQLQAEIRYHTNHSDSPAHVARLAIAGFLDRDEDYGILSFSPEALWDTADQDPIYLRAKEILKQSLSAQLKVARNAVTLAQLRIVGQYLVEYFDNMPMPDISGGKMP